MNARRLLELSTFAALAWFASAHWADGLVAGGSGGRVFLCVAIATAAGVALSLAGRLPRPWPPVARVAAVPLALVVGVVAIGLDRRLLAPGRWGDLADGIDRGFAALSSAEWPYSGPEPWARLVLLLAIPLVLGLAAGFAFARRRGLRPVALVLLVALYGTAVTEHRFGGELARGLALLVLMAAWMWLPGMSARGWRTAAVGASAVLAAAVVALPAAARYDDREPWVDYESWNPFAADAATRYDWSHSYGPIDWPRDGRTLMQVRSDKRHYWRVETLDRFDGFRWVRSGEGRGVNQALLPRPYRREWETSFRVTIRDLDTDVFPVAGTMLDISGAEPLPVATEDGTVEARPEGLDEGESYSVRAYVPDPSPAEMRATPRLPGFRASYVPGELLPYTQLYLPPEGVTALDGTGRAGDAARSAIPAGIPATRAEVLASPYAPVMRLAERLTTDQPTGYDKVRAIERHLRTEYGYSERPPSQEYPLAAFLFEDRIGYCQQFSGAMALMLRMVGIPARVAAGFTPGSYNRETREYRVRDLDAHSWVEVWFTGVGWVAFDPTPSVAPAELQSSADAPSASAGAGATEQNDPSGGGSSNALSERAGDRAAPADPGDPALEGWTLAAVLLLGAALLLAAARLRVLVLRRRDDTGGVDRDLADLTRALAAVGDPIPARVTLRELEARLARTAGASAAHYARLVRECRYGRRGRSPDAAARRDLRRALVRGRGPRARLAALYALPPVSFRRN